MAANFRVGRFSTYQQCKNGHLGTFLLLETLIRQGWGGEWGFPDKARVSQKLQLNI